MEHYSLQTFKQLHADVKVINVDLPILALVIAQSFSYKHGKMLATDPSS